MIGNNKCLLLITCWVVTSDGTIPILISQLESMDWFSRLFGIGLESESELTFDLSAGIGIGIEDVGIVPLMVVISLPDVTYLGLVVAQVEQKQL